jgi:hypothetical protein
MTNLRWSIAGDAEERGRSSESLEAHVRSTKSSSGACWNEAAMELGTAGAVHV